MSSEKGSLCVSGDFPHSRNTKARRLLCVCCDSDASYDVDDHEEKKIDKVLSEPISTPIQNGPKAGIPTRGSPSLHPPSAISCPTMNPPNGGEKVTARISFVHTPLISLSRPHPGKVPDRMDEMCLTYSVQTARGRSQNLEPKTYSICLRKVYPHEVTDYLLGKGWRTQQTKNIPLPPEGQPTQERYLDESEASTKPDEDETRYWEQGWYLWTTSNNKNAVEKLLLMSQSLKFQDRYLQDKFNRDKDEQNEQMSIEQLRGRIRVELDGTLSSIRPPDHLHYHWQSSSLTQIPSSLRPLFDPVRRLLAPTVRVWGIFRRSFESGSQREFARRVLEKAHSAEPFILGRRLCKKAWEMITGPPDAKSDI